MADTVQQVKEHVFKIGHVLQQFFDKRRQILLCFAGIARGDHVPVQFGDRTLAL